MTKTLLEIWHSRNKPLLSERGLTLILRERGLNDSEIKRVLKEISFSDILKKAGQAAKTAHGAINTATGKITGKSYELKASSKWKKYAAGAGIKWYAPNSEEFLDWLENTYNVPDSIINKLKIGNERLVNIVSRGPSNLTRNDVESLLKQLAHEEFKFVQSGGRYPGYSHEYDTSEKFKNEFLNALKKIGISDENAKKLTQEVIKNPDFLNQLLSRILKNQADYGMSRSGA